MTTVPADKTLRVVVCGRVQGVAFRAAMQRQATALGVRGWVRNRSDGCVEAVIAGAAADVDRLLDWVGRGPPAARVDRVLSEPAETPRVTEFQVRPTV